MEHATLLLTLAAVFGIFMAWGIGANDVANAMATSVGSKALKLRTAIIIAAIFEFSGAYLAGGEVTSTIRKGMVDANLMSGSPELLIYGMLSALLAAGVWLMIATRFGLPVSTTKHSNGPAGIPGRTWCVDLPASVAGLAEAHRWISSYEFARNFAFEFLRIALRIRVQRRNR